MVEKSAAHSVAKEAAATLRPSSHWTGWGAVAGADHDDD
jgi:hypothetical protein